MEIQKTGHVWKCTCGSNLWMESGVDSEGELVFQLNKGTYVEGIEILWSSGSVEEWDAYDLSAICARCGKHVEGGAT